MIRGKNILPVIIGSYILLLSLGCSSNEKEKKASNINIFVSVLNGLDEKKVLVNSSLGDYTNRTIIKKNGHIRLELWKPYYDYMTKTFYGSYYEELPLIADIDYDEIWITEYVLGLSKQQILDAKGTLTLIKLYWKDDKVQAYTVEAIYSHDPLTNKKLPKATYKIDYLVDRPYILKNVKLN